jgi:hypothetical protein
MPLRPGSKLPDMGEWQVVSGFISSDAPFGILHVEFGPPARGWVKYRNTQATLLHINELSEDKFSAQYDMWGHRGGFDAEIRADQSLELSFIQTSHQPALTCRTSVLDIKSRHFSLQIANMSPGEKLEEVISRSLLLMPGGVADQIKALLTKQSLAIMGGVLSLWGVSHFFGVGELADVVLLFLGAAAFGMSALDVANELLEFMRMMQGARTDEALDMAAEHFARAVSIGGANAVMAILLGKAPKVLREVYTKGVKPKTFRRGLPEPTGERLGFPKATAPGRFSQPTGFRERVGPVWDPVAEPMPSTNGKVFYEPKINFNKKFTNPNVKGNTTWFGDIQIKAMTAAEETRTLVHETVHRFLSPRLQLMRGIRIQLKAGSYSRSYILRYLEEALAEAAAAYRYDGSGGLTSVLSGIRFPVANGYVTIAKIGTEARGILQGPIIVGGVCYQVWFVPSYG